MRLFPMGLYKLVWRRVSRVNYTFSVGNNARRCALIAADHRWRREAPRRRPLRLGELPAQILRSVCEGEGVGRLAEGPKLQLQQYDDREAPRVCRIL